MHRLLPLLATACLSLPAFAQPGWNLIKPVTDIGWVPRAGLQVTQLGNRVFLMGGRTPIDPKVLPFPGASVIWDDVWASDDLGTTWSKLADAPWSARAYFRVVSMAGAMYVLGGQDFNLVPNPEPMGPDYILVSNFFSDVWRSTDGATWTQLTTDAGWIGRAGLSSVVYRNEIYVFGGSKNDDEVIGGPNGPARIYFNDVWKSSDGITWRPLLDEAPWEARAGAVALVKDDYIYLIGGEAGFLCQPVPCTPPYFNDVWRTMDGVHWELVTAAAPWQARPGHVAVVADDNIVLFGGFGQSQDPNKPFEPSNPMDVWTSEDGARWRRIGDAPWNAASPIDIKYDLDAIVVPSSRPGGRSAIYTFGGDRETFNFFDPLNFTRVDNDVWRYVPPLR